jgi:hypothetical protein
MRIIRQILISIFFIFSAAGILIPQAFAKDISFGLSLDRDHVEVGDVVQLSLVFENSQSIPAPQMPEIEGIRSQYVGPTTRVSNVNGEVKSSITHRYRLVVMKTGDFTLGPFTFSFNGDNYTSPSKQLTVVDRGQAPVTSRTQGLSVDSSQEVNDDKIFVILSAQKNKVYLNEPISVTVKLYVDQISIRGIEYPVLNSKGLVVEPYAKPLQYKEQLAGVFYDVVEFNTTVYASQQGSLTVGPAKIKGNAVARQPLKQQRRGLFGSDFFEDSFFGDFFGRSKLIPIEVSSPELTIEVLPFPEQNKPKEFNGAVGDFKLQVEAAPKNLKAGDPITLNMTIQGKGNFDSVKSPQISDLKGFKSYNSEVQDAGEGRKIFEQVIIPQSPDIKNIPSIKFAYFDPEKQEYVTRQNPPIDIAVSPADEKVARIIDTSQQSTQRSSTRVLGQDIVYIKEDIGKITKQGEFLHQSKGFALLIFIPLLLFGCLMAYQFQQKRLISDVGYARKLKAPRLAKEKLQKARQYLDKNKTEEFYEQTFKTLQEYLGNRFNLPSAGITAEVVESLMSSKNLDKNVAEDLKQCFSECDMARYASASLDHAKMQNALNLLERAIDYLERHK